MVFPIFRDCLCGLGFAVIIRDFLVPRGLQVARSFSPYAGREVAENLVGVRARPCGVLRKPDPLSVYGEGMDWLLRDFLHCIDAFTSYKIITIVIAFIFFITEYSSVFHTVFIHRPR